MKIFIGSDHSGYKAKEELKKYLSGLGYKIEDRGALVYDTNDDYPDFITLVAEAVAKEPKSRGIVLGGSGQGEAMCANRFNGVRAAVFYGQAVPKEAVDISGRISSDPFEMVILERMHNDANVLSFGVRFVSLDEMKFASELFLKTEFSGEERHIRRINKLG